MTWVKIDDGYHRNPKVRAAGLHARALHLAGLCWTSANLHDGRIPRTMLALIAAEAEVKPSVVARLVEVGLWHETADGWEIHDYLEYNRSAEQVMADRSRWRSYKTPRGRRSTAESTADSTAESTAGSAPSRPDPTRPVVLKTTDNSSPVAPDPGRSSVDTTLDEAVARLAVAAGKADHAGWCRAVRANLLTEHGDGITRALAAGDTPQQIAARIAARQPAHQPYAARHPDEYAARSMVAGLVLTGEAPEGIWHDTCSSYPDQHAAIADELHTRTGWTPPDAQVIPLAR